MDSSAYAYATQNSSHRGVAMVLALVVAIVLSPLYVDRKYEARYETKWNSSFVVPMVLVGLIIAIKTTSSSSSDRDASLSSVTVLSSSDTSRVLSIGGSSWGLAGVLIMLMVVLSWQNYVHNFFSR